MTINTSCAAFDFVLQFNLLLSLAPIKVFLPAFVKRAEKDAKMKSLNNKSGRQSKRDGKEEHSSPEERKKWGFVEEIAGSKTALVRKAFIEEFIESIKEQRGGKLDLPEETYMVMAVAQLVGCSDQEAYVFAKRHEEGKIIVKYFNSGNEITNDPYWDEPCYVVVLA